MTNIIANFMRLKNEISAGDQKRLHVIVGRLKSSQSAFDKQKLNIVIALFGNKDKKDKSRYKYPQVSAKDFIHQVEETQLKSDTTNIWNETILELQSTIRKSIITDMSEAIT